MRFLHLSDLHLGKKLGGYPLLEEQKHILTEVLTLAVRQHAKTLVIAGDIFDQKDPSPEVYNLFRWFLCEAVAKQGCRLLMICGNHDSAARLGFPADILALGGQIHLATQYQLVEVEGVQFHLLPHDALKDAEANPLTTSLKPGPQVLVAHLFAHHTRDDGRVETPTVTESDTTTALGGLDAVELSHFARFDYLALGHLHRAQKVGEERFRYSGAPLAYSCAEAGQQKSVTLVEIDGNGCAITPLPLTPLRSVWHLSGRLDDLKTPPSTLDPQRDYVYLTVTEPCSPLDLQPVLARFDYLVGWEVEARDTLPSRAAADLTQMGDPEQLISRFWEDSTGEALEGTLLELMREIVHEAREVAQGDD